MKLNSQQDTPRSQIKLGGHARIMGGSWLVTVDEAWVDETGALRCSGRVASRPLCDDTLVRGETHPVMIWTAR